MKGAKGMSDKPLFNNTDEQEALYAPQQLPEDNAARDAVEHDDSQQSDDVVLVPGAAAGSAGMGGTGPSTGTGTLSGVAPVPVVVPESDTETNDDRNDG